MVAAAEPVPVTQKPAAPAPAPAPHKAAENPLRVEVKPSRPPVESAPAAAVSPGEKVPVPDAWLYQQELRPNEDSQMAVRRAAEFLREQRTWRLESRRWFGLSNLRPSASPDPVNGDYSPSWVSNNPYNPSRWVGAGN